MDQLRLLCVHPHPDDESIACGGVLARYAADPLVDVALVTCTGGEAGENLAGIDLEGRSITEHRRAEMGAALAALGVDDHTWLGYRDSGMQGTAHNEHSESFHAADLDDAAGRLARVIRERRPHVVVSDDERGTYGHPDHVKAHRTTVRALELAADPSASPDDGDAWEVRKHYVVAWSHGRLSTMHRALLAHDLPSPFSEDELASFGYPDERVTARLDVTPWLAAKRTAMLAHQTQIASDSFFFNLPDDVVVAVLSTEEFVLERGVGGATPEDDLFAGLR